MKVHCQQPFYQWRQHVKLVARYIECYLVILGELYKDLRTDVFSYAYSESF